jgi:hypothetical protein
LARQLVFSSGWRHVCGGRSLLFSPFGHSLRSIKAKSGLSLPENLGSYEFFKTVISPDFITD